MFRDRALRKWINSPSLWGLMWLCGYSYKHAALFLFSPCRVSVRKWHLLHLSPAPTRKSTSPSASLTWMVTWHFVCQVCRNITKGRLLNFCMVTCHSASVVQGQDISHVSLILWKEIELLWELVVTRRGRKTVFNCPVVYLATEVISDEDWGHCM